MNQAGIEYLIKEISDLHIKVAFFISQNAKLEEEIENLKKGDEKNVPSEMES